MAKKNKEIALESAQTPTQNSTEITLEERENALNEREKTLEERALALDEREKQLEKREKDLEEKSHVYYSDDKPLEKEKENALQFKFGEEKYQFVASAPEKIRIQGVVRTQIEITQDPDLLLELVGGGSSLIKKI